MSDDYRMLVAWAEEQKKKREECWMCHGRGGSMGRCHCWIECPACNGTGGPAIPLIRKAAEEA